MRRDGEDEGGVGEGLPVGRRTHSQALPLPDDSLTSALSAAISNLRPDRVWERALAAAAALAS